VLAAGVLFGLVCSTWLAAAKAFQLSIDLVESILPFDTLQAGELPVWLGVF